MQWSKHGGRWQILVGVLLVVAAAASVMVGTSAVFRRLIARRTALQHQAVELVERRIPPLPPFRVKSQQEAWPDKIEEDVADAGCWADSHSGGRHYVAFQGTGLLDDRDLYVGVERNGDGLLEAVYPTGLQDVYYSGGVYGLSYSLRPRGELQLSVTGSEVVIWHHRVVERLVSASFDPADGKYMKPFSERIESTVSLAELTRDTDGDYLTDIAESLLWCDPGSADADGDGTPDALDATPNVDPASMGSVERGVARALTYFFTTEESVLDWWEGDATGNPWQARYMLVYGCGPVAFSGDAGTYGICLIGREDRKEYSERVGRTSGLHDIAVQWMHRDMSDEELYFAFAETELLDQPPTADDVRRMVDGPGGLRRHYLHDSECVVLVDFWLTSKRSKCWGKGYRVKMLEVDGEYYPLNAELVWIG